MTGLGINKNVRFVEIGDRVVVLDLASEAYYVLDPSASRLWKHVVQATMNDEAILSIAREHCLEPARVRRDVARFLAECRERRLLLPSDVCGASPAPLRRGRPTGRGFLALRAWWSLVATARGLAKQGFAAVYRRAVQAPGPTLPPQDAQRVLSRAELRFGWAENFVYLKRAPRDCLPRSLALFTFLRDAGLPAEHHIGVRLFPFQAHAWVECCGRVVRDNPSVRRGFTTIARIAA